MYQVYVTTRDGRPKWAVGATGACLLAAVGIAALVIHLKSGPTDTLLDQAKLYESMGLAVCWPADWEVGSPEKIAHGGQMVLATDPNREGRELVVFSTRAPLRDSSIKARMLAVVEVIGAVFPGATMTSPERIGMTTLDKLESDLLAMAIAPRRNSSTLTQQGMATVAAAPDGRIIGVILTVEGELKKRDHQLLESVSQAVSRQNESAPEDPASDQEIELEPEPGQEKSAQPPKRDRRSRGKPVVFNSFHANDMRLQTAL